MKTRRILHRLVWASGMLLTTIASVSGAAVSFTVNANARVDCQESAAVTALSQRTPVDLSDVPLAFEGVLLLRPDGTAIGRVKMTAYYLLSFRAAYGMKLGAPPASIPDVPGSTAQIRVLDESGLSLIATYPQNQVVVNARLSPNGKGCVAEFLPTLKGGHRQHMIPTGEHYFYCDTFTVQDTRCKLN